MIYNSANDKAFDYFNNFGINKNLFRLGTVVAIETDGNGKKWAKIMFYGENKRSEKRYKALSTYIPAPGECVLLARVNNSYVILGGII